MARAVFGQQARAIGRLFTIASNFTDPTAYFVGGGVVEVTPAFRKWFLDNVRESTQLRQEQAAVAVFALVPDLDMAGARGAARAALEQIAARLLIRRATDAEDLAESASIAARSGSRRPNGVLFRHL